MNDAERLEQRNRWYRQQAAKWAARNIFSGPPRDPARIPVILDLLRQAWELAPDLRLGQLVVNVSGRNDPHGVEDDEMEQRLREYLERVKGEGDGRDTAGQVQREDAEEGAGGKERPCQSR